MTPIAHVDQLAKTYELVVIGAGPAGMAAATLAAAAGASVLLVDENPAPGGQIYRGIGATPLKRRALLGKDYWKGEELTNAFAASGASYFPGATVWQLAPDLELGISSGGRTAMIRAAQVVMATGALERPFPINGWTLPGVMTAGAAQILLKTSGVTVDGKVVLAGSGPLLWLIAAQYLESGKHFDAILDTTPRANWSAAIGQLPRFLASPYLAKGLKLMAKVRRRARVISGVTALEAQGEGHLARVRYTKGGKVHEIGADHLLLHQGVVPNINMASASGCELEYDPLQLTWKPKLDEWGRTSVEGITIAGDGGGIAGAEAAAERGRIAGLAALAALRRISPEERDRRAAPIRAVLARYDRGRAFLDRLYQPAQQFRVAGDDTLACRCEEVTGGQIRNAVKTLNITGPNQLKSFLRCGMGPCQGRLCGLTVSETIAEARGTSAEAVGYYRLRAPVKPITLAELATLDMSETEIKTVARG
ncbi:NAD(P)/FAD-dependent oxidoreductase [Aurantimonas endophytica]|uniref:NADPH-dependent 2,4-dienoyl-CoA reductase/sulfur reductase-like enzyme n=1 Tax=Aurantimonas endophytica TaxID=1522175 RepID=A0A7W6MR19_9HYPH|nr:NAD(P)/FAD-dependent oxidoreductase [Aurantimonas endophytica]MBB4004580.1 NADPH-dependent 2,4-dienoyl-CoA reductase/sulfur reductase-like enzyme [Aurantimonas endophytica]MCO6405416.1 FAD-dependent oxidoreductase [Aurantimonas endophytica]